MHWFTDPIQNHYADFTGRATRQQFWMFVLINFLISIAVSVISGILHTHMLSFLYALAFMVPMLAIAARRLHDIGKSGWWQLIALIPYVGSIILIVLLALKGDTQANKYGPSPYGQTQTSEEQVKTKSDNNNPNT